MRKLFCEYCGTELEDGCDCLHQLGQEIKDFHEDYDNRLDILEGQKQQDIIDMYRRER